jgi:integrin beta 3
MTVKDLAVIVKGIAPVVREYVTQLADRLTALETKAKGDPGEKGDKGDPGDRGADGPAGRDGRDGVQGIPGEKGADGLHGKDGADGLGFEDLSILHDGERTVTFRFLKGDKIREFAVTIPAEIYRGVYTDGKTYDRGDCATWAGSEWHCNETTTMKPGDSKAWTLKVKKGRDGKDGQDAPGALPIVKVGAR